MILIDSKKYFNLILFALFTLGYFVLICITFPDAYDRSLIFYMENEWAALSIIISTPLAAMWVSNNNIKKASTMLIIIFIIRLGYIGNSYDYFHTRLNNLVTTLQSIRDKGIYKAIIIEDPAKTKEWFIIDWGLPIESILLSKMDGDRVQTTIKIVQDSIPPLHTTDSFHSSFDIQPIRILNNCYFVVDTSQHYEIYYNLDKMIDVKEN